MFTLSHKGEKVGTTMLERGEPSERSVSGEFSNIGGAKALAGWIKSIGGQEDDGVVFVALDEGFTLVEKSGHEIKFKEAHLISVPNDDEVYLDINGVSEEHYNAYFANHQMAKSE